MQLAARRPSAWLSAFAAAVGPRLALVMFPTLSLAPQLVAATQPVRAKAGKPILAMAPRTKPWPLAAR